MTFFNQKVKDPLSALFISFKAFTAYISLYRDRYKVPFDYGISTNAHIQLDKRKMTSLSAKDAIHLHRKHLFVATLTLKVSHNLVYNLERK